jgi:hypothetical protein
VAASRCQIRFERLVRRGQRDEVGALLERGELKGRLIANQSGFVGPEVRVR